MSVGVGVREMPRRVKVRIGVAFASAEILMNCIGAALGAVLGRLIGDVAGYLGFVALVLVGAYMLFESLHGMEDREPLDLRSGWGLFVASMAISLDSLGIGFSILYIGEPFAISLATIGAVSVAATAAGLTLGRYLGTRIESAAEMLGGILIALTGIVFIALKALNAG